VLIILVRGVIAIPRYDLKVLRSSDLPKILQMGLAKGRSAETRYRSENSLLQ